MNKRQQHLKEQARWSPSLPSTDPKVSGMWTWWWAGWFVCGVSYFTCTATSYHARHRRSNESACISIRCFLNTLCGWCHGRCRWTVSVEQQSLYFFQSPSFFKKSFWKKKNISPHVFLLLLACQLTGQVKKKTVVFIVWFIWNGSFWISGRGSLDIIGLSQQLALTLMQSCQFSDIDQLLSLSRHTSSFSPWMSVSTTLLNC